MKNKTRISALLITGVILATLYAPIVVAGANGSIDPEHARIQEILNKLPPNPNRPTPKYIVTAEDELAVNKLSEQMTKEKAVEIVNNIPKPKDGEIIPLTLEQRAALNKTLGEEMRKIRTAGKIDMGPLNTADHIHAIIRTNQTIYTDASNTIYGTLPILTSNHFTLLGTWFCSNGSSYVDFGIIRAAPNTLSKIPDSRIYTYIEDVGNDGWQPPYDVVGNNTQVYSEIMAQSDKTYIVWLGNRVISNGKHLGSLYNWVDMGGEQYDSTVTFATGTIGYVIKPQLLDTTFRWWNSAVPTTPHTVYPMNEQITGTSQGYNVRVYSQY